MRQGGRDAGQQGGLEAGRKGGTLSVLQCVVIYCLTGGGHEFR